MADYGSHHRRLRAHWHPIVQAGGITCPRCLEPIEPGTPWELGHTDDDTGDYNGPEHRYCNRRAGGEKRQASRHQPGFGDHWSP